MNRFRFDYEKMKYVPITVKPEDTKFICKSVTDKSTWRPTIDLVRAMDGTSGTPVYDFPDGKDTGDRPGYARNVRSLDVVEQDNMSKLAQDLLENANEEGEKIRIAKLEEELKKVNPKEQPEIQKSQDSGSSDSK